MLIFYLEAAKSTESVKVTVRPSGTEPKIKMYFEIRTSPVAPDGLEETKEGVESILRALEKAVMSHCYGSIGVDFPERGFLLFWQLPLDDKMRYFEIEPKIERVKDLQNAEARKNEFVKLISFLGSNPLEKMDEAFTAKYRISVLRYLDLEKM